MLIIKAESALERITVWGEVPEHPDVRDVKPNEWSAKAIRPIKIKAVFNRADGGPWELGKITLFGFDVLKSGRPSDNPNCYHDMEVPEKVYAYKREFSEDQFAKTEWAREWAAVQLVRINDVAERADLDSDVVLGEPVDLDEPQPRRFPLDSPEPRENGLRVRSTVNDVVFIYQEEVGRWLATTASGGDGNTYSWSALNGSYSEYATGEMVEVLL
ncbi:hypothetical protein [Actinophytocola sp.]|uniref:hypothetical protein n=1 Tax=Actinophytocola sp. TaxID=1872138 RepID=UPI002D804302|nr:hypothetical protein [Actinophytocola sp.]HET9144054.1 hypothetical protein [Actinophytocola sp.]